MAKFKIEVELTEEQIQQIFEDREVKYSKAKAKSLKESLDETEMDLQAELEEVFENFLSELVLDIWGE